MKEQILSCPCCGSIYIEIQHNIDQEGGEATVECSKCGMSVSKWDDFNCHLAEEKAIKAWNKTSKSRVAVMKVRRYDDGEEIDED